MVLIIFLLPVIFLLTIELILRVGGYGYSPHFFVRTELEGKEIFTTDYHFFWRFFPRRMARQSIPLNIPVEKKQGTIRIIVLGSSAAMGDPDHSFSFSRFLEIMLKEKYPAYHFEIYNTAATAINSNVIHTIADECRRIKPDLFIVYAGNNEVIGPYGPATAISPFVSSLHMIRARIWLSSTKLGQLSRQITSSNTSISDSEWKGMAFFIKQSISYNNPKMEPVYSHFHENLIDICRIGEKAGARVILSTVLTNEKDCAPFLSKHKSGLQDSYLQKWSELFSKAIQLDSLGQYEAAKENYLSAAAIDAEFAELQFRLGHCYLHLGKTREARDCFIKARDYDELRFRADSRINDIVRLITSDTSSQVILADAEKFVIPYCDDGVIDNTLLWEHVHLNPMGNYLVSKCILEKVEHSLNLVDSGECLSYEKCELALAITSFDTYRILKEILERKSAPPFTNQYNNGDDLHELQQEIENVRQQFKTEPEDIDSMYLMQIAINPNDWLLRANYLKFLFEYRRNSEAFEQARAIYQIVPFDYTNIVNLGTTLLNLRRYQEAEQYFRHAISFNSMLPKAYNNLGVVYFNMEKYDEALQSFKKTIYLNPNQLEAYPNIASILSMKGQHVEAISFLEKAIKIKEVPEIFNLMGQEYVRLGNNSKAQDCFEQAKALEIIRN